MNLQKKYQALLQEAQRQGMPEVAGIRLCFQVLSLANTIDHDCATLLAPHGLSEGRFVMLFLLNAASDGLSPHALAEQAGVSRATVTGLLDGLENEGLIKRHPCVDDRRATHIRLTTKGQRVAKQVFEQHGHWIASLFMSLSSTEKKQLTSLLSKVATHLDDTRQNRLST